MHPTEPLLRGLRSPGARAFAGEYLARPFVGRASTLAALDGWLARPDAPARLMLCAEAGRGKSALLLRWALRLAEAGQAVAWVPVSVRFETARGTTLERALTDRLAALGETAGRHWADAVAAWPAERPLLIVVDGLDEALDEGLEAQLRALAARPGVRVAVSARRLLDRDAGGWAARLGWLGAELLGLGPLERDEVAALVGGHLRGDALTRLVLATGGDPLLVSLQAGAEAVVEGGVEALFAHWWQAQERAWAEQGQTLGPVTERLLAVLGCACGPVEPALLAQAVEADAEALERALAPLGRFVVRAANGAVVLAHPRLGAFFRERLSDAQARAVDARLAELGRAALAQGGPLPAYLVRWLRVHLERLGDAAGVQALVQPAWLDAHRALEGGDAGFEDDLRAAWRLADLRFASAATPEQRRAAVADQAACLTYRAALEGHEAAVDESLRAELVRHGLRSERAALRSLERLTGWEHRVAAEKLIPVLSDGAFRELLEAAEPKRGWPVPMVVARLRALGDLDEACAWLAGARAAPVDLEAVAGALPGLDPARRARLQDAVAALPEPSAEEDQDSPQETLETLLARARVLDPPRRDLLLERVARGLDALGDAKLFWDSYYDGTDPRLELARALAEAGAPEQAVPWLERVVALPFPFASNPVAEQEPDAWWAGALLAVARPLGGVPPSLRAAFERALQLPQRPKAPYGFDRHLALLPLLPEAERNQALEADLAWARAQEGATTPLFQLALLSGGGPVPDAAAAAWGERVLQLARADQGMRGSYGTWYELSQWVLGSLPAMAPRLPAAQVAPLAEALEAWVAKHGPDSHGRVRLGSPWSLNMLSALLRREPELARARLRAWAALPEPQLWRIDGWEAVLPFEERRARLEQELRGRPRLAAPEHWVPRLEALASALPAPGRGPLARVAAQLARRAGAAQLARAARFAPPALQAELVEELLAGAPPEPDARNHLLRELVPHLASPELRTRLARVMAAVPEGKRLGDSPWWLEPASQALPEAEWEGLLRGLLARGALGRGALYRPYLPPALRAEVRAESRPAPEKLNEYAMWLAWHAPDLGPAEVELLAGEHLARVAPGLEACASQPKNSGDPGAPPWLAMHNLTTLCRPEQLARVAPALEAGAGTELLGRLVARCREAGDEAQAQRYLAALRRSGARGVESLSAELARLAPGARLADVLRGHGDGVEAYPWVLKAVAEAGRAGEHARDALALASPSARLGVWAGLWPHLPAPAQEALRDAVALAAAEEQGQPGKVLRVQALGALSDAQVARLWARDGADGGWGAYPVAYYRRFGEEVLAAVAGRVVEELSRLA